MRAPQSELEATAAEIRDETGVEGHAVAGDVTTDAGREALLAACPEPDILVNNAGGPPPGDFRDWTRDDWIKAIDANMLSPIVLIKATVDGMIEPRLRPHRQHHLALGEGAARHSRSEQRRARRPDRICRRRGARTVPRTT